MEVQPLSPNTLPRNVWLMCDSNSAVGGAVMFELQPQSAAIPPVCLRYRNNVAVYGVNIDRLMSRCLPLVAPQLPCRY